MHVLRICMFLCLCVLVCEHICKYDFNEPNQTSAMATALSVKCCVLSQRYYSQTTNHRKHTVHHAQQSSCSRARVGTAPPRLSNSESKQISQDPRLSHRMLMLHGNLYVLYLHREHARTFMLKFDYRKLADMILIAFVGRLHSPPVFWFVAKWPVFFKWSMFCSKCAPFLPAVKNSAATFSFRAKASVTLILYCAFSILRA